MRPLLYSTIATLISAISIASDPIVHTPIGTYHGRYLPTFNQDIFLGVKYAPKPVRFAPSHLINTSHHLVFNATQYGTDCQGYGSDTNLLVKDGWTNLGEDCLQLNIIKPRTEVKDLPVLVWIYGGGWQQGATSDPRYDL